MNKIATFLPQWVTRPAVQARRTVRTLAYRGTGRTCPVCGGNFRQFLRYGEKRRQDAMCPRCGSLERHRLVWLFFGSRTSLFSKEPPALFLHIAPEQCFESRFRERLGPSYLTADLHNPRADVAVDVTDLPFPDAHFDAIYCSHVLEHVPNDRQALREFHRVLKTTGWAILLVPITADETYEDPSITDPNERLRAFGQEDHVRRYGPDYVNRLSEAGFNVRVSEPRDFVDENDVVRFGLTSASGEIFYCTKSPATLP